MMRLGLAVLLVAGGVLTVMSFTIDAGKIVALDVMRNPEKLAGVADP